MEAARPTSHRALPPPFDLIAVGGAAVLAIVGGAAIGAVAVGGCLAVKVGAYFDTETATCTE